MTFSFLSDILDAVHFNVVNDRISVNEVNDSQSDLRMALATGAILSELFSTSTFSTSTYIKDVWVALLTFRGIEATPEKLEEVQTLPELEKHIDAESVEGYNDKILKNRKEIPMWTQIRGRLFYVVNAFQLAVIVLAFQLSWIEVRKRRYSRKLK